MIASILLALVPIALLIALGHEIRRRRFLADGFWPAAERLSYFVLLPALFVHALATADLGGLPVFGMAASLFVSLIVVSAILIVTRRWMGLDPAAFTSVFQGGVRFNNYVGISAAVGLFGAAGLPLAAVATATIVPTVNVLCVLVFARWGVARASFLGVLRGIAVNPLVIGCVLGILLQVTGLGLPRWIEPAVRALGQASLPLGLLCVGAAFDWRALGRGAKPVAIACLAKFVLLPLVTAGALLAFGVGGQAAALVILFQSLPTASSSYVMARQLGGDAPLMAAICAFQTVFAAVAVPLSLLLLAPR